jgi:hypothetical protein
VAKKKPSARAQRRQGDRDAEKLVRDVRRLHELSPGGRPETAMELISASEVEVAATAQPCPLCTGALSVTAHEVVEDPAAGRLRLARLVCRGCRSSWVRYYRLGAPPKN